MQAILFLRVHTDVGGPIETWTRRDRTRHRAIELAAKLFFHQPEEFINADLVEHIFESRLGAIGTVAGLDENAYDRIRYHCRIAGLDQHACVACETLVAGQTTKAELEPDARRQPKTIIDLYRLETDVVGILQHRDDAGAIKGDVEFARQAVKRAIIENVEMPLACDKAACRSVPADRCRQSPCR